MIRNEEVDRWMGECSPRALTSSRPRGAPPDQHSTGTSRHDARDSHPPAGRTRGTGLRGGPRPSLTVGDVLPGVPLRCVVVTGWLEDSVYPAHRSAAGLAEEAAYGTHRD